MAKQKFNDKEMSIINLQKGREIVRRNDFFWSLLAYAGDVKKRDMGSIPYQVTTSGKVYVNPKVYLSPEEWAVGICLCILHKFWGHYNANNMPGYMKILPDGREQKIVDCNYKVWNIACDAWGIRFLKQINITGGCYAFPFLDKIGVNDSELEIYDFLMMNKAEWEGSKYLMSMEGLDHPLRKSRKEEEEDKRFLGVLLSHCVTNAVRTSGGDTGGSYRNTAERAAEWFIGNYPLLSALAASFEIVYDSTCCIKLEIQVAAIDIDDKKIYVNPAAGLNLEELKFVLAHEFLHAGLKHRERRQGRDPFFWNCSCDFIVNGWVQELGIGRMPDGTLYDESLKDLSAETIYDQIISNMKQYKWMDTFRGYKQGDLLGEGTGTGINGNRGIRFDEFCREALMQGLEYQMQNGRGFLPAGLVEEIRALSVPAPAWDVELARWFAQEFPDREKRRTYARPSRRQGATPDIPRPRYAKMEKRDTAYTFGVIIDTSGSMSQKMIGIGLGAVASYAAQRGVSYVRVVFNDAWAYDAGYLAVDEIAGRVEVKGRGGTRLQPGIDLLEKAEDFPKDGPLLVITDGEIENNLRINRKHAFLIPKGRQLPFRSKGAVFYFSEN